MPSLPPGVRDAESPEERLPDLAFLALVRESLERSAPGVTQDAELKGNSLHSPRGGWVVGVAPRQHGGIHHYDLVAMPDVSIQPDVPCFIDCAVGFGNPRRAADAWVQTAGACLLELLDRRGHFADHTGPEHGNGVPGWHMIASGAVGFGADPAESRRLQHALVDADVLHHVADTFIADLEEFPFFNGIKVFYGGEPGSMRAEIRVNGGRHEAASAAMGALDLPEPTTFTTVRSYALLLPVPPQTADPRATH